MKRSVLVVALGAFFALTLSAQAAFADSPHFVNGPTYTATTTELTATGKAAGLGNSPTQAQLTAQAVNVYSHCVNKGGNFAPGHPATQSPAAGVPQDIAPRNGQITFSPTLPAPSLSVAATCPNGNWRIIVDEVDYLGVVLTISQGTTVLLSDGPNDFTSCAAGIGQCVFTG
jgi:hypothetical protein